MLPFSYDCICDAISIRTSKANERVAYLDQEVEITEVIVTARRSVTSHYLLSVNFSLHGYVLAYGKTKNILRVGECETVAECILI